MAKNEAPKREKPGEFRLIYKTFICLEAIINKFEKLLHNLPENEKDIRMSDK